MNPARELTLDGAHRFVHVLAARFAGAVHVKLHVFFHPRTRMSAQGAVGGAVQIDLSERARKVLAHRREIRRSGERASLRGERGKCGGGGGGAGNRQKLPSVHGHDRLLGRLDSDDGVF